jgi:hypothetical protein
MASVVHSKRGTKNLTFRASLSPMRGRLRAIGVIDRRPYLSARDGRAADMAQPGVTKMPSMTKIALAAAIVLSTTLTASAATEHRRAHAATYNADPGIISDACQPVGPPCRTKPDGW